MAALTVWPGTGGRPVVLDLFAGGGGAGAGYQRAGFATVGVDWVEQPRYPGPCLVADVMELGVTGVQELAHRWGAVAIAASPPCQAYSPLNAYNKKTYPDLVGPVRDILEAVGMPFVIENVVQAPLIRPTILCGSMFGLRVYRHRGFETSFPSIEPEHPAHQARCARNGYLPEPDQYMTISGGKHSRVWRLRAAEVMGVPWMTTIREVCESIPPRYTEFIGAQLMGHLRRSGLIDGVTAE